LWKGTIFIFTHVESNLLAFRIPVNLPLRASPLPLSAAALSAPVLTSLPAEQRARSTALARLAGSTGVDTPPPAPKKSQCWKWLSQFELQQAGSMGGSYCVFEQRHA
jgi:hypothetical protein